MAKRSQKKRRTRLSKKDLVVLRFCDNETLFEVVNLDVALEEGNIKSQFPAERREFSVNLRNGTWTYKDAYGSATLEIGMGASAWQGQSSRPRAVIGVFNRNDIHHLDHMVDHAIAMKKTCP